LSDGEESVDLDNEDTKTGKLDIGTLKKSGTFTEAKSEEMTTAEQKNAKGKIHRALTTKTKECTHDLRAKMLKLTILSLETYYSQGKQFLGINTNIDKPDPYVKLEFNGQKCRTKITEDNFKPFYDQRFCFLIEPEELETIYYSESHA